MPLFVSIVLLSLFINPLQQDWNQYSASTIDSEHLKKHFYLMFKGGVLIRRYGEHWQKKLCRIQPCSVMKQVYDEHREHAENEEHLFKVWL